MSVDWQFTPAELIRRIRDQKPCPDAWLGEFVAQLSRGDIPDYQASALLMAVYFQGLNFAQTLALTLAMRDSGIQLQHPTGHGRCVDKHSTGGVGDKISLIVAPLAAACGLVVPMVSGRGLGHTGGTLDKLEAIPGFCVDIDSRRFNSMVAKLGVAMMGQSSEFCPADRKLYALRDVTATVESIPLIVASILSKKLAEGLDALVLDVKVGHGAFMKTLAQAQHLAEALVAVGRQAGLKVKALLTQMDRPLGFTIGNALEVKEAIAVLRGEGPRDVRELSIRLVMEMLALVDEDSQDLLRQVTAALDSGQALQKFGQLIGEQGGNAAVIDEVGLLPQAGRQTTVMALQSGYVTDLNAYQLGVLAMHMGAGRKLASDRIDPSCGIELLIGHNHPIRQGEPLMILHHHRAAPSTVVQGWQQTGCQAITIAAQPDCHSNDADRVLLEIGGKNL